MPSITNRKSTKELCPNCNSRLILITERWDAFPTEESPTFVIFQRCNICNYEKVILDEDMPKATPYERKIKRGLQYQL